MKKNRLIVGGYSCIRAVKSYIPRYRLGKKSAEF